MTPRVFRDSGPWIGRARDWGLGGILLVVVVASVALTLGWGPVLVAPWRALTPAELLPPPSRLRP